ncbi:hypothetical protein [Kitasatospora sp. NPDC057738]|uniref:hypothetical protein n=1 Tax=Kitasatospora sp. NPDC057738 TaxID=3346233 RepID=UPI0036A26358
MLPLHRDPRFQALYQRIRVTQADLDEFYWLHQEMQTMSREAQNATVDNLGRLDTGVSPLPKAPLPTREPNTPSVLITRLDLAAIQTALQQAAIKAEFQRSAGNTALDLINGTWDHPGALHDTWYADDLDTRRQRAAEARASIPHPAASTTSPRRRAVRRQAPGPPGPPDHVAFLRPPSKHDYTAVDEFRGVRSADPASGPGERPRRTGRPSPRLQGCEAVPISEGEDPWSQVGGRDVRAARRHRSRGARPENLTDRHG